jgi:hypothetical protein
MMKKKAWILFGLLILMVIPGFIFADVSIDLSDKLLKIDDALHNFDDKGFGFYDQGSNTFKIFDWDFKIKNEIPIKAGEGPGEVRRTIRTACLYKDKLLVCQADDNKISIFTREGKYYKDLILNIYPRKIMNIRNMVYIFNSRFCAAEKSPLLALIIDPDSGKTIKEVRLIEQIVEAKSGEEKALTAMGSYFAVGETNHIYLLLRYENTLYEIDENGKCILKTPLPYKWRERRRTEMRDGNRVLVVSNLDLFWDMKIIQNTIFACFFKTIKEGNTSKENICETYVIKLYRNGKHSEKIFTGLVRILGEANGNLYLFNRDDYQATQVKLSEWD